MRWEAASTMLPGAGASILEIGCGRGAFAARMAARGAHVTALEPDKTSFMIARRLEGPSLEVRNIGVEAFPELPRFDCVCAFEVIEHIEDDAAALKKWGERIKAGGQIVISAPAYRHRYGAWDEMVGHYRRYDAQDLRCLLEESGMKDVEITHYGFPVGPLLEHLRNRIAKRRLAEVDDEVFEKRTASSGRILQPEGPLGGLMKLVNPVLCELSKRFPDRGVGLLARARVPR
ncbi:MAG: class I SAM-dependent methyltransferase [Erythrobacter sp.]|nr:class I SAM-dependent methyltransferase [Erythrobacter sp.]MDJ0976997.1 class I SAM-dependent methyltransferase [Erythrobacter sp.]